MTRRPHAGHSNQGRPCSSQTTRNGVPVDQNIRCVSGDQAPPVVAQGEPGDRAFCERPDAIEFKRVDACPVLDEVATGEVRWVVTVEQSESSNHNGEINPARYRSRGCRFRLSCSSIPEDLHNGTIGGLLPPTD